MIINEDFKPKRKKDDRLPPGQYETRDFPVLSLGPTPRVSKENWSLEVFGLVKNKLRWNWEEFGKLPMTNVTQDIHCVTQWSKFDTNWRGVKLDEIIKLAEVDETANHLIAHSYDGYTTNIPLGDVIDGPPALVGEARPSISLVGGPPALVGEARPFAMRMGGKAMIATSYEGEDIAPEHGGPARLLVPHLYFWKSAKWLKGLEFVDHDQPGFWEIRGYHNHGDPWLEERYSSAPFDY